MKLRDYQLTAVEKVLDCWKDFKSCLIVLPTGCGKTVVFAEIIRRILSDPVVSSSVVSSWSTPTTNHQLPTTNQPTTNLPTTNHQLPTTNRRAMILAHREELITQARDKVSAITGEDVQIEMGAFEVRPMFDEMPPVVVSTVQTQCSVVSSSVVSSWSAPANHQLPIAAP